LHIINTLIPSIKIYHLFQLEARALEIYGTFQKLEEIRIQKEQLRETQSEKRFEQKIRKMRKEVGIFNIIFL
jgi:hypothetical protein